MSPSTSSLFQLVVIPRLRLARARISPLQLQQQQNFGSPGRAISFRHLASSVRSAREAAVAVASKVEDGDGNGWALGAGADADAGASASASAQRGQQLRGDWRSGEGSRIGSSSGTEVEWAPAESDKAQFDKPLDRRKLSRELRATAAPPPVSWPTQTTRPAAQGTNEDRRARRVNTMLHAVEQIEEGINATIRGASGALAGQGLAAASKQAPAPAQAHDAAADPSRSSPSISSLRAGHRTAATTPAPKPSRDPYRRPVNNDHARHFKHCDMPLVLRRLLQARLFRLATFHILQTPELFSRPPLVLAVAKRLDQHGASKLAMRLRRSADSWAVSMAARVQCDGDGDGDGDGAAQGKFEAGSSDGCEHAVRPSLQANKHASASADDPPLSRTDWIRPEQGIRFDAPAPSVALHGHLHVHLPARDSAIPRASARLVSLPPKSTDPAKAQHRSRLLAAHYNAVLARALFSHQPHAPKPRRADFSPSQPPTAPQPMFKPPPLAQSPLPPPSANYSQLRELLQRVHTLRRHRGFVPDVGTANLIVGSWMACWKAARRRGRGVGMGVGKGVGVGKGKGRRADVQVNANEVMALFDLVRRLIEDALGQAERNEDAGAALFGTTSAREMLAFAKTIEGTLLDAGQTASAVQVREWRQSMRARVRRIEDLEAEAEREREGEMIGSVAEAAGAAAADVGSES